MAIATLTFLKSAYGLLSTTAAIHDQAEQLNAFVTGASTLLQQMANAERKAANRCLETAKKTKNSSVMANELDRAITYLKLSFERRAQGAEPGILSGGGPSAQDHEEAMKDALLVAESYYQLSRVDERVEEWCRNAEDNLSGFFCEKAFELKVVFNSIASIRQRDREWEKQILELWRSIRAMGVEPRVECVEGDARFPMYGLGKERPGSGRWRFSAEPNG